MKEWDVFISYAGEDRRDVATPLAEALTLGGLNVWLDVVELRLGDSIRETIDSGLSRSRFGIVIISPAFLGKTWPMRELNALFALEEGREKVILPVWHRVDHETLVQHSPILADRFACDTNQGIQAVARHIIEEVLRAGHTIPSLSSPKLLRKFFDLLDDSGDTPIPVLKNYLSIHHLILVIAVGARDHRHIKTHVASDSDDASPEFMVSRQTGSTLLIVHNTIIGLSLLKGPIVDESGDLCEEVQNKVLSVAAVVRRRRRRLPVIGFIADVLAPVFTDGVVVAGRRNSLSDVERQTLRRISSTRPHVQIRTYDWLVDAARNVFAATAGAEMSELYTARWAASLWPEVITDSTFAKTKTW